jgi:hypothetical protein
MRRLILLVVAGALLSGCGELPRPFVHDEGAEPALATPAAMQPIAVSPVPGRPGFAEAMVAALGQQDIPASLSDGGDRFLHLTGTVRKGDMVWTLAAADGKAMGETAQPLAIPVESGAAQAAETLAAKLRGDDLGGADLAARPRVVVDEVIATGGLDAGLLKRSLILALQQKGVAVSADKARLHVHGGVRISSGPGGKDLVEVTWIVDDDQGKEVGKVNQGNMVPHDEIISLGTRMTHQIAEGGAEGVAQLVHLKQ